MPLRRERAQIAPNGVFGHAEFGGQRGRDNGLAGGEPARDQLAPGDGDFIVHAS